MSHASVPVAFGLAPHHKDQIVFSQGDPADAVFYIQKGKVKVTVVSKRGKEAAKNLCHSDSKMITSKGLSSSLATLSISSRTNSTACLSRPCAWSQQKPKLKSQGEKQGGDRKKPGAP